MIHTAQVTPYLFRYWKKSVPFLHTRRISAPGIVINNPKIIDFYGFKFYVGPHKGGFGIVNNNHRRTYCPILPKIYIFGIVQMKVRENHVYDNLPEVSDFISVYYEFLKLTVHIDEYDAQLDFKGFIFLFLNMPP